MDSHDRIICYRKLLRQPLPSEARHTLEWLLVDAVRDRAAPGACSATRARYPAPKLVALADKAVTGAARLMGSQFANMQLYIASQDTLLLLAYRNFDPGFVSSFASFTPDGRTTCSRAVATGERVVLEDIERDAVFAPHVRTALMAGFRALQSTPLKHESGKPLGVLTTHFAAPRAFSNDELGEMDVYARQVSSELARACA